MPERVVVIGVGDPEGLPKAARRAVEEADLVVGGRRNLDALGVDGVVIGADVGAVLDAVDREPGVVCVLASGDPGFFGIVRPLAERFGSDHLDVHPSASSVSVAFGRLGMPWDDATVVSVHGRALDGGLLRGSKVAVLTSPDNPPEAVGRALGDDRRAVAVCSRVGLDGESVVRTDVAGLAAGTWDPLSVVVLLADDRVGRRARTWGGPDAAYAHRAGMITKAEVRAVVLSKLQLPAAGVLWDVGAGSGSIAIEAASLSPALRVLAVERRADDAERIATNGRDRGVAVDVIQGEAPEVLASLPAPDRAFVGGGGLVVLDAVIERCPGPVVATYAALDRAAAGADRLGNIVQINVARGERLPDGGMRLASENPVFVAWSDPA